MGRDCTEPVHAYIGAVNIRDVEGAVELFSGDAQFDAGPFFERPYTGHAAIRSLLRVYFRSLPELTVFVRDLFVAGQQVLATVDIQALTGENPDPDRISEWQAGRRIGWRGALLFDVSKDSKIQRVQFFGDLANTRKLPESVHPQ